MVADLRKAFGLTDLDAVHNSQRHQDLERVLRTLEREVPINQVLTAAAVLVSRGDCADKHPSYFLAMARGGAKPVPAAVQSTRQRVDPGGPVGPTRAETEQLLARERSKESAPPPAWFLRGKKCPPPSDSGAGTGPGGDA